MCLDIFHLVGRVFLFIDQLNFKLYFVVQIYLTLVLRVYRSIQLVNQLRSVFRVCCVVAWNLFSFLRKRFRNVRRARIKFCFTRMRKFAESIIIALGNTQQNSCTIFKLRSEMNFLTCGICIARWRSFSFSIRQRFSLKYNQCMWVWQETNTTSSKLPQT